MIRLTCAAAAAIGCLPAAALAQDPAAATEWTLREAPGACSVAGRPGGAFVFVAVNPEGGSMWRVHHPDLVIPEGAVLPGVLRAGETEIAFDARGARTSDAAPGFTAAATEAVRAALGKGSEAKVTLDGGAPIALDLTGLPAALAALEQCAAKLIPRDPATIPASRARALSFPSITRSDLPTAGATARVVAFRLAVAPNGSVAGCSIVESSGAAPLDAKVCAMLEEGARFEPARNAAGDKVADTFQSRLKF